MEKPSSFDSLNDVETDNRISIQFSKQEDTRDNERKFAGTDQDFRLDILPHFPDNRQERTVFEQQLQQPQLYQCSSQRDDDFGSGSDSAKEEDSPYGSIELPKHEALVPSGAEKENSKVRSTPLTQELYAHGLGPVIQSSPTPTSTTQNDPNAKQIVTEESTDNFGQGDSIVPTGSRNDRPKVRKNPFEDLDVRLATFLKDMPEWPHRKPSAEEMAAAGMIFIGAFHIKEKNETFYDMVECYKCRKRMYAFTENDDPGDEHRKLYPHCI